MTRRRRVELISDHVLQGLPPFKDHIANVLKRQLWNLEFDLSDIEDIKIIVKWPCEDD